MASDIIALIRALDNASWRELLLGQLDTDVKAFNRSSALFNAFQESEKAGKLDSALKPSGADCARLIEIAMVGQFPPDYSWHPVGAEILSWFWTLTHPCFAPQVEKHYAAASDGSRAYGLTLLANQSTSEAAASIVKLIREYPLPERLPPRFFWEINKRHAAIGPLLFPKLLLDAGPHIAEVMNFMNVCLEGGTLSADALAPASEWAAGQATRLLDMVEPLQRDTGKQWRWDEQYQPKRTRLGVFLDLLGIIPGVSMEPCVRAIRLKDPLLVFFAVVSMLKKNMPPPNEAIQLVAESLETRVPLYNQLGHRGRRDLFPAGFSTFESFAAADMVEWLLYPGELGYEPNGLELMARLSGMSAEAEKTEVVMCLWRVTREDGLAFAAASGPYEANAPIGLLSGGNRFSNFAEWNSRTADEHLREIVETLDRWRVEWCKSAQ